MAGFVVNKFRGDESLLAPGLDRLRELTGRPTYGVLPVAPRPVAGLRGRPRPRTAARSADRPGALRVAVVRLPRISNFTDVDALGLEPGVDVVFASTPRALADADLVVLPGTRATIADLAWLRERGLDRAIVRRTRAAGRPVLGICGGFQMLGRPGSTTPTASRGRRVGRCRGWGCSTSPRRSGPTRCSGCPPVPALGATTAGYEIHHGRVRVDGDEEFLGGARRGAVFGTMWHGSLEGDGFRHAFLAEVAAAAGREWASVGRPFRRRARAPAGPARRPGGEAPGRRRAAPARGCRRVTQATPRAVPCMRDSASH